MKRWQNIALQVAGVIGNATVVGAFVPPQHQQKVFAGIAVVQALVSIIASNYNPDGTPAKVAYDPNTAAGKILDEALKK